MICGVGINDLSRGWRLESELNKRIYDCWAGMIQRCYSNKKIEKRPTYKECYVCDKWLRLSGFLEDIKLIDGYDLWLNNPSKRIALDKDIKSNGKNKCYCLEQCMFVTNEDNIKQSNKTMNYTFTQTTEYKRKMSESTTENHITSIVQLNENKEIIKIWRKMKVASEQLKINYSSISYCCKGAYKYTKTKNGIKTYWKYLSDCADDEIKEYIIKNLQVMINKN